jgi:hypothetical protein
MRHKPIRHKIQKTARSIKPNLLIGPILVTARANGLRVNKHTARYMKDYNIRHGRERSILPEEADIIRDAIKKSKQEREAKVGGFDPAEFIAAMTAQPHGERREAIRELIRQGRLPAASIREFSEKLGGSIPKGFREDLEQGKIIDDHELQYRFSVHNGEDPDPRLVRDRNKYLKRPQLH